MIFNLVVSDASEIPPPVNGTITIYTLSNPELSTKSYKLAKSQEPTLSVQNDHSPFRTDRRSSFITSCFIFSFLKFPMRGA